MRFDGHWSLGHDGILRPVLKGYALAANGSIKDIPFMVDTGADRTVFSAQSLDKLGKEWSIVPDFQLEGVGGFVEAVSVDEPICFIRESGVAVPFTGPFLGFTDPNALELSILGRDLLNHFTVIVDRPSELVVLLTKNHSYSIQEPQ